MPAREGRLLANLSPLCWVVHLHAQLQGAGGNAGKGVSKKPQLKIGERHQQTPSTNNRSRRRSGVLFAGMVAQDSPNTMQ